MKINLPYHILLFNFILAVWIISIPFKNSIYQISNILLVIYFFSFLIYTKDFQSIKELVKKYSDLLLCFLFILSIMIISNLINNVDTQSWKLVFYYFQRYGLILFILIYFYSKSFFSKKLLFILILSSLLLQSFDGIFQSIYGFDIFKHNLGSIYRGLTGAVYNRNVFGFFMGLGLLLTFLYSQNNKKIFFHALTMLFLFCVLFSYSRAIWVSLFFSLLIYAFLDFKEFKKNFFLIISLILAIGILLFTVENLQNRVILLFEGNSSHRTDIWIHGLTLIKEKLFLGYGIDTLDMYAYKGFTSMHNQTLEILFDLGIIGLMAFFTLLVVIFKELKRYNLKKPFYIFLYFLVNGIFGESIISSKTMLSSLTIFVFFVFINRLDLKEAT